MKNKVKSLLGLARVAKKIICGTDAVCENLSLNKIYYLFVASDASTSTIERILKKGYFYNIPVNKSFTSDELNACMGLKNMKAFGIADKGFAKSISELLEKVERESN